MSGNQIVGFGFRKPDHPTKSPYPIVTICLNKGTKGRGLEQSSLDQWGDASKMEPMEIDLINLMFHRLTPDVGSHIEPVQ